MYNPGRATLWSRVWQMVFVTHQVRLPEQKLLVYEIPQGGLLATAAPFSKIICLSLLLPAIFTTVAVFAFFVRLEQG